MGLFKKFFGISDTGLAKCLQDVEARHQPILNLSAVLVRFATDCAESIRPLVVCENEKDVNVRFFEARFEFIYFGLHMVSRTALVMLGNEKRIVLCDRLSELIPPACVESFVGHWPKPMKEKIRMEIYENLNSAEQEYGKCRSLASEENPFSENTLFGHLVRSVAHHLGREGDFYAMAQVLKVSAAAYTRMDLCQLVRLAGAIA